MWALGEYAFKDGTPEPISILVVTLATFAAGYFKSE